MTDEERLNSLEKPFRDKFPIVVNGINLQVSYPELPKKETTSLQDRIAAMEKVHKEFSIVGGGNCNVSGSLKTGFCVNSTCPGEEGTGGIPTGTPPATGACCVDGVCSIQTPAGCEGLGGDYQGDGTDCDPNPCPPPEETGACCHEDNSCTIETEEECDGIYQGDGTICDDVDCTQGACCQEDGTCIISTQEGCESGGGIYKGDGTICVSEFCCPCGFDAFDESGKKFLRYQRTISGSLHRTESNTCAPPDNSDLVQDTSCSAFFEAHYDPTDTPPCSAITDSDTSSSSSDITSNGVPVFSCSRADIECFCSSIAPNNQCDGGLFVGETTNCGCPESDADVVSTETMRTTTYTFNQDCSVDCVVCPDCTLHCTVSGSYVVTETLSEECVPLS